jgi:hypothetical protein
VHKGIGSIGIGIMIGIIKTWVLKVNYTPLKISYRRL